MSQQGSTADYSPEELLKMLHDCKEKHGKATKKNFESDPDFPDASVVEDEFGSWSEAKTEAGIPIHETSYSDEDLLQMLRDCKEEHGMCSPRLFNQMEDTCTASIVMRRFDDPDDERGGWQIAKEKAGIEEDLPKTATGRTRDYTDEQVLSNIRECYESEVTDDDGNVIHESGKCTVEKLQEMDKLVSPSVAVERFGSWLEAKAKAGVGGNANAGNSRPREYTDEDYLELLRECEEKHGKVTQSVFNDDEDFPSAGAVRKRFDDPDDERGGWSIAKEKAGIGSNDGTYSDDELLNMLQDYTEKHDQPLSVSNFKGAEGYCSPETIQRRFSDPDDSLGGWERAKRKAGVADE